MTDLFAPLTFAHGPARKNRFALAPMTNLQSDPDGRLSDAEFEWLVARARGGFALTMSCAAHVQRIGQGFPGQLGVFGEEHMAGLTRLAAAIRQAGSLAVIQLHHAGIRSPKALIGEAPVGPSDDAETGARALSLAEVEQLREDFIDAAVRCDRAGFDGVEIHGAHGYILAQFLSPEINQRDDRYGGSLENRASLTREIIAGIRARCRADFQVGLRLSPERFGQKLGEILQLSQTLMTEGEIDYLDASLWDYAKEPNEPEFQGRSLLSYFTALDRGAVRLGCAGKVMSPADAQACLDQGADFVLVGQAAVLHHDYPNRLRQDPAFRPVTLPVTRDYLRGQYLSPPFIDFMARRDNFVVSEPATAAS